MARDAEVVERLEHVEVALARRGIADPRRTAVTEYQTMWTVASEEREALPGAPCIADNDFRYRPAPTKTTPTFEANQRSPQPCLANFNRLGIEQAGRAAFARFTSPAETLRRGSDDGDEPTRVDRPSPDPASMLSLLAVGVRALSAVNRWVGSVFSWLSVGIVAVCFTVVVQRYVFHVSRLELQDLYVWLNGAMFTAVAGFAMLRNDHIRVDIFYRPATVKTKAIIDLLGTLVFLLPFVSVVGLWGWGFVARSWRLQETSGNIGGMPGLFVLKSFILVFVALIALQGIAWILRSILVLAGGDHLLPPRQRYEEARGS